MPITSKMTNLVALLFFTLHMGQAKCENSELLLSNQNNSISLKIHGKLISATSTTGHTKFLISSSIKKYLTESDEVITIQPPHLLNSQLFIVLARAPSRPGRMGKGVCGAGYEESLLLISVHKDRLELADKFKLQSCLQSIIIYSEETTENAASPLHLNPDGNYEYRLEKDDESEIRILTIENDKFKLAVRKKLAGQ